MKNILLLIISLVALVSCGTISSNSVSNHEPASINSNKNNFKIEKLNSDYYLISNKYDSIKYLILIENPTKENHKKTKINFDNAYEVNYHKGYMIIANNDNRILFNIPSYNYTSKSVALDNFKPSEIINVAGITKTTLAKHDLTYYYEDEFPTDGGGGSANIKCTSGGDGATQCATSSTIDPVSTGCEVTCSAGYYACCDDGRGICRCVKK